MVPHTDSFAVFFLLGGHQMFFHLFPAAKCSELKVLSDYLMLRTFSVEKKVVQLSKRREWRGEETSHTWQEQEVSHLLSISKQYTTTAYTTKSKNRVGPGTYFRITHESTSTQIPMTFGLFVPSRYIGNIERGKSDNVPVMYWLSGLT